MGKRTKKRKKSKPNGGGAFGAKKNSQVAMTKSHEDVNHLMAIIQEQMREMEFDSDEAARAYIQETFMSRPIDKVLAEYLGDKEQQVARLLSLAEDKEDVVEAKRLIRHALKIDPDSFDAKVLMTRTDPSLEKGIVKLQRVIGEELPKFEADIEHAKENNLDLWGFPGCHSWLDAQFLFAKELENNHEYGKAIAVFEYLLKVNPGDNLGVRSSLVIDYLITGQLTEAKSLLDQEKGKGCEMVPGQAFFEFATAVNSLEIDKMTTEQMDEFLTDPDFGPLKIAHQALQCAIVKYPWSLLFLLDDRVREFNCDQFELGLPDESFAATRNLYRLFPRDTPCFFWLITHGLKLLQKQPQELGGNLRKHAELFNELLTEIETVPKAIPSEVFDKKLFSQIQANIHQLLVEGSSLSGDWEYYSAA